MVIDFHTHIFPERIAERTIEALEAGGNTKAYTKGTLEALKGSMRENDVTISIVLPVVTKPAQFDTVNAFAADITEKDGIISFGGIHPQDEDYRDKLNKIKELGLKGIKLHPDYQETYVDDPRMVRIIRYAAELGLIVVLHAGLDIGLPDPIHCTPHRAANMLSQIDQANARIVLAHMGGFKLWDDVEACLVGKNVWFDTSYSLGFINDSQFVRIIKNHGADRILFATDSPWSDQGETLSRFRTLDFTDEEFEQMLWRNGTELLGA